MIVCSPHAKEFSMVALMKTNLSVKNIVDYGFIIYSKTYFFYFLKNFIKIFLKIDAKKEKMTLL